MKLFVSTPLNKQLHEKLEFWYDLVRCGSAQQQYLPGNIQAMISGQILQAIFSLSGVEMKILLANEGSLPVVERSRNDRGYFRIFVLQFMPWL